MYLFRTMEDCVREALIVQRTIKPLLHTAGLRHDGTWSATAAGPITLSDGRTTKRPLADPFAPAPSGAKPDDKLVALEKLHNQSVVLGDILGQIRANFGNESNTQSVIRTLEKMRDLIEQGQKQLRIEITKRDAPKAPPILHKMTTLVEETLDKFQFDHLATSFVRAPTKAFQPPHDFVSTHIGMSKATHLKGSDGYVHPNFIVYTGIQQDPNLVLLATATDWKTPNRIRWEAQVAPKDVGTALNHLLVQEGLVNKAFPRNIPVPKNKLQFVHDAIKSTHVDSSSIIVTIKPKVDLQDVANELFRQLAGLVHSVDPKNRDQIRYVINAKNRTIKFVFSLPKRLQGQLVSDDVMIKIKRLLNATPEEIQRIRTALEHPTT